MSAPKSPHKPAFDAKRLAKIHDAELDADSPHGRLAESHQQPGVNHRDAPDSHDPPATGGNGISANFEAVRRDLKAAAQARLHAPPKVEKDRAERTAPEPAVPEKRTVPQNAEQGQKRNTERVQRKTENAAPKVPEVASTAPDVKGDVEVKSETPSVDVYVPEEAPVDKPKPAPKKKPAPKSEKSGIDAELAGVRIKVEK